jgi:hypothetical protein
MTTGQIKKQQRLLRRFVQVFCTHHHETPSGELCEQCDDLLGYAAARLAACPMDPKPKCRDCPVHCYRPDYRRRIREVMKFSGMHFVRRGRVDWLVKYFLAG